VFLGGFELGPYLGGLELDPWVDWNGMGHKLRQRKNKTSSLEVEPNIRQNGNDKGCQHCQTFFLGLETKRRKSGPMQWKEFLGASPKERMQKREEVFFHHGVQLPNESRFISHAFTKSTESFARTSHRGGQMGTHESRGRCLLVEVTSSHDAEATTLTSFTSGMHAAPFDSFQLELYRRDWPDSNRN